MKSEIEFIAGIQSWGNVVFKEKKGGGLGWVEPEFSGDV